MPLADEFAPELLYRSKRSRAMWEPSIAGDADDTFLWGLA
jgi:hypothetical protein